MSQHPAAFVAQSAISAAEVGVALPARKRTPLRRLLLVGAGLLALAASAYAGERYWKVWRFEVSTDDAYVQADNTTIAPKISGYIGAVAVEDNQTVKAGQTLATIDDRDYRVALDSAVAGVAAATADVQAKRAGLVASVCPALTVWLSSTATAPI